MIVIVRFCREDIEDVIRSDEHQSITTSRPGLITRPLEVACKASR